MTHDPMFWFFMATLFFNGLMTISIHMGMHVLYERIKGAPEETETAKAKAA